MVRAASEFPKLLFQLVDRSLSFLYLRAAGLQLLPFLFQSSLFRGDLLKHRRAPLLVISKRPGDALPPLQFRQ